MYLNQDARKETAKATSGYNDHNYQALVTIIHSLDDQVSTHIEGKPSAKKAWKTLRNLFQISGYSAHHLVIIGLMSLSLELCSSMQDLLDTIKALQQELKGMGHALPDWVFTSLLLQSLNDSWECFVSIIVLAARDNEPDFNEVGAQILDEQCCRKGQKTSTAMLVQQKKAGQQN
jgi:hypothetical protein